MFAVENFHPLLLSLVLVKLKVKRKGARYDDLHRGYYRADHEFGNAPSESTPSIDLSFSIQGNR